MPRYLLSSDSYVCVADDHAVFLDLKRDKYSALEPAEARILDSVVREWPISRDAGVSRDAAVQREASELAQTLLKEGLITDDERLGKPATPVRLQPATRMLGAIPGPLPRLDFTDFRKFVSAWAVTTSMLRCFPLKFAVERARRRKLSKRGATGFDLGTAQRLAMDYSILQPNFFSSVDKCLRNSLTFTEFLSRYGLYPTWVFGVRMNPFAAHSWVQEGDLVLNDHVEHVRTFVPIMTI